MPSLDIYSFGMVVLFLFSEQTWWRNSNRSLNIKLRQSQVKVIITEIEGLQVLQKIAKQLRQMLHPNPKRRPDAKGCVFELSESYHGEELLV